MPINIYRLDEKRTEIAWLCPDIWHLPEQIEALEKWIGRKRKKEPVACVADIGFCWRKNAAGGGSSLTPETMKKLADFNVTVFLSEYAGFGEAKNKKK